MHRTKLLVACEVCFTKNPLSPGDISALMSLGAFYSRGTGVKKDYEKSFNCYKAAADQGTEYCGIISFYLSVQITSLIMPGINESLDFSIEFLQLLQ